MNQIESGRPALTDLAFLGLIRPDAAPSLILDARIAWGPPVQPELPYHFLAPLAGPDGQLLGHVEFRFLTTIESHGRYVATGLHAGETPPVGIPVVPTLSPYRVTDCLAYGSTRRVL